jgi:hypothetical protein
MSEDSRRICEAHGRICEAHVSEKAQSTRVVAHKGFLPEIEPFVHPTGPCVQAIAQEN